jgi:hypothetical protein
MAKLKNVEKKIWEIEGFDVRFTHKGKDVRGDKKGIPQWEGKNHSRNDMTVKRWKEKFKQQYPGYDVDVLDGNGDIVKGGMKLYKLRDTYSEDDQ